MGERFLSVSGKFNSVIAGMVLKMLTYKRDEYYTKKDVLWSVL